MPREANSQSCQREKTYLHKCSPTKELKDGSENFIPEAIGIASVANKSTKTAFVTTTFAI